MRVKVSHGWMVEQEKLEEKILVNFYNQQGLSLQCTHCNFAFRATGIYPLNIDAIPEHAYLLSSDINSQQLDEENRQQFDTPSTHSVTTTFFHLFLRQHPVKWIIFPYVGHQLPPMIG